MSGRQTVLRDGIESEAAEIADQITEIILRGRSTGVDFGELPTEVAQIERRAYDGASRFAAGIQAVPRSAHTR